MSDMHKRSSSLRSVSSTEPGTKSTARRQLMYLLTKDEHGLYPWSYTFKHDSFPDRVWGPYSTFEKYLNNIMPDGTVGAGGPWSHMNWQDFREWFAKDAEIVDLLDAASQRLDGRPTETVDNIHGLENRPTGTSKDAGLRRLRKDRPDLHAQVIEGELSVHAAMLEAGFRKKMMQVPAEDLPAAVRKLENHYQVAIAYREKA